MYGCIQSGRKISNCQVRQKILYVWMHWEEKYESDVKHSIPGKKMNKAEPWKQPKKNPTTGDTCETRGNHYHEDNDSNRIICEAENKGGNELPNVALSASNKVLNALRFNIIGQRMHFGGAKKRTFGDCHNGKAEAIPWTSFGGKQTLSASQPWSSSKLEDSFK